MRKKEEIKNKHSISVFFPALNEGKNIRKCIEETTSYLKERNLEYEIIVVNDASDDNTADIVKEEARKNPNVILINKKLPHGYGGALKKGFYACSKELIFFTDADLQFDIEDLDKFLVEIDKYDYIIGYREKRSDPYIRSLNAKLYKFLIMIILGLRIKDTDCAFKLFNADIIHSIKLSSNGALISAELLYKLQKKKYKFKEIPVLHYPRKYGNPTGAKLSVIFRMFIELFKLKFNLLD